MNVYECHAQTTLEISPLISMQHSVLFQDTLGDEALSTLSAHMLPLLAAGLAMHGGHMVRQVGLLSELLVTDGAEVGLLASVAQHVPLQLRGSDTDTQLERHVLSHTARQ